MSVTRTTRSYVPSSPKAHKNSPVSGSMPTPSGTSPSRLKVRLSAGLSASVAEATKETRVPDRLLDQVIGQDKTVEIVRKAAEQKRHVMLIGDPGTGKSMVARAMTEFLPRKELEDIICYPNNDDSNMPHIRVVPGGKANEIVKTQRDEAKKRREQQNTMITTIVLLIIGFAIFAAIAPTFQGEEAQYNNNS